MGVDTKGCLVTSNKDVFRIADAIQEWFSDEMNKEGLTFREFWKEDPQWKSPRFEIGHNKTASVHFKYKGEERRVLIYFDCDCDLKNHEEIKGDSCIWFSLGCWGSSEYIMRGILEKMKDFGNCYIDVNDCDDVGYEQI